MKIFAPNYTQVPNIVIDDLALVLSDAAFKIYVVLIRKTKGWDKDRDAISLSQFMKLTGKSKPTVVRCLEELVKLELIKCVGETKNGNEYQINLTFSHAGIFIKWPSKKSLLVKNFYPTSKKFLPLLVKNFYTQKKLSKDTNTKDIIYMSAVEIFEYWKTVFKKNAATKLSGVRESKLKARLKEGYSVDDIKKAILNCSQSDYHVQNGYTDLELICRDQVKLDRFISLQKPRVQPAPDYTQNRMADLEREAQLWEQQNARFGN